MAGDEAKRLQQQYLNTQAQAEMEANVTAADIESAEQSRAALQGSIGTGAYQGQDPMAANELAYSGQYSFDQDVAAAFNVDPGSNYWGYDATIWKTYGSKLQSFAERTGTNISGTPIDVMNQMQDWANSQMDQVRALEAEGRTEEAAALRENIDSEIQSIGGDWAAAFNYREDPDKLAEFHARSQMGQIVDVQLQEGRAILDRDSEVSQAYRQSLTEGATRATAARERMALRSARDFGLSRGSATNPAAQAATARASAREFAFEFAQIEASAAQQYENYRVALGQNAVAFANQWIDQAAGIRDEFTEHKLALAQSAMQMYTAIAGQQTDAWSRAATIDQQQKVGRQEMIGTLVGAGVSLITGSIQGAAKFATGGA